MMDLVFLMYTERSGSNLLSRMINTHSQYCAPPPSHLIRILSLNIHRYGDLRDVTNWDNLLNDVVDLMKYQLGQWACKFSYNELKKSLVTRNLKSIVEYIYSKEMMSYSKSGILIKENHLHMFFPFLQESFPKLKCIYLTRDPRDMALSWKKSPNHPGGVMKAAEVWQSDQQAFVEIYEVLKEDRRILKISYEDLISKPEITMRVVCDFLNIGYEKSILNFYNTQTARQQAIRLKDWENLSKPVMPNNSNKFIKGLSKNEIKYVEQYCKIEMNKLGYVPFLNKYSLESNNIEELEKGLKKKTSNLSSYEKLIREKRLQIIQRIINR